MLNNMEDLINDLREYNYNNQCSANVPCKYWRAECCIFDDRCRFKHFKINKFPLDCPYGYKCKRKIAGKCNCVINIRKKFNHRLDFKKSGIGKSNGNNKNLLLNQDRKNNKQVYFSQKIITNNGINKPATIAKIKIPQFNSNKSDRLELSKCNNIVSDNQSDIKEEEKQTNFDNNNNNNNDNISSNNINNNNNELNNDKVLPDIFSELNLNVKENGGNMGNRMPFKRKNLNGIGIRTSNLQMTKNEKLDSFGAISFDNNNNNSNNNNNNNNKQSKETSHIDRVKEKRRQVLARHNINVLCPSLHNKNNNNKHKNKNKNSNNNNNNGMVMLNDILDDNITPNISFDSLDSENSSSKENDGTIGNRDTYHSLNGSGIKSLNLQLTGNDSGDSGAVLSSITNMVCNNNKGKNTDLSKLQDNLEQIEHLSDISDGSIVSTSTDAILRNSEDDDDDD